MPARAQCGLRFAHGSHDLIDGTACEGRPWPTRYHGKHVGIYKPEPGWVAECQRRQAQHRRDVPAVITCEPGPLRPLLRLGWPD